ncbi:MAG: cell division protein ZapA [Bacteroidales bacterium]|nr:cell division protein ZapA [Bacteroidales bacterium]MBP5473622.1 cell division protein ZapA [Bacteroidales bacterium]
MEEDQTAITRITVNIADRYYPLRIEAKDEERIRKSVKLLNDKVLQYKQRYTDKDGQDFLAMAAIQFVNQLMEQEDELNDNYIPEVIKKLNEKIDDALAEKE